MPSLTDALYLSIACVLCFNPWILLKDGDVGFHIRAGEYILQTGKIPTQDLFSFYAPALPWMAHSWLTEVVMGALHQSLGLAGVVLFYSFIAGGISSGIYELIRMRTQSILLAIYFFLLISMSLWGHWLARPHMISMLFIIFWVKELWQFQTEGRKRSLYLAPLGMLLWVNLHGGFIMGFVLFGVYLLGNALNGMIGPADQKSRAKAKAMFLLKVIGVMLVAALGNPHGVKALIYPFQMISNSVVMNNVSEFLSPDFHEAWLWPFRILLYLLLAAFALRITRYSLVEILLCLLGLHMALFSVRHVPYFAIFSGPCVASFSQELCDKSAFLKERYQRLDASLAFFDQSLPRGGWAMIGSLVLLVMVLSGRIQVRFSSHMFPVDAVSFVSEKKIPGRGLAEDEFADYILYKLWPLYTVFAYGSNDTYSTARIQEYQRVMKLEPDWNYVLERHAIGWILIPHAGPLAQLLTERPDWKLIYQDTVADLFVKNTSTYQKYIENHGP